MRSDILDWDMKDAEDFAQHNFVQVLFSKVHRYKIDGLFQGLDVLLKIAPHDSSPSFKQIHELWGEDAVVTINIPMVYSNEFLMLLKLIRYDFVFDTDVLQGYQDAIGIKLRKLVLIPDDEVDGDVLCYLHAMNDIGDGMYIKVPVHDGLAFALSHKNVPMYTSELLFLNDHLRMRRREMAKLESRYGLLSSMTWREKVMKAMENVTPSEFELYASRAVIASNLNDNEMEELRDIAVANERYEWAQFLTGILER